MPNKPIDYAISEYKPYGILISGYYSRDKNYSVKRPSGTMDWLLMYTVAGEGIVQVEGERIACREGDVAILLPGLPHHYGTSHDNWEFGWVHFIPDPLWLSWLRLPQFVDGFIKMSLTDLELRTAVVQAWERMNRYSSQSSSTIHTRLAMLALEEGLLHLCSASPANLEETMDSRVAEALTYLQHEYRESVRIPELAKRCCLSPSRLSHLFKEQVGESILNVLHKIRAEKAAELLACTTRQISEIANDVGFEGTDHFTRVFQKAYGQTPSQYRKMKLEPSERGRS
ncbi:helix-turn-helix domain-containing protein [Paenibacillus hexagrammi]|uniref:Helix-turn-helix domain-containing protein n=1 Tax=Paenibacillus hexagrammi TaxID=2908839 RepID=A0ABY3SLR1_9BACL|nr:helix-turn-helix domain-containing protein [Paenibacillus sp. YPD9-1]UJF34060.1 helix-turn-helix domain-containing protein [Paenibacillus sp. YPD9-1]